MRIEPLKNLFVTFLGDESGESVVNLSLMFAGAVALGAVLAVPLLNNMTNKYVASNGLGVDPVTTSSTASGPGATKRYIKRRSVLDEGEITICHDGKWSKC